MADIAIRIFTWLKGERVGADDIGNVYFREKGGRKTSPIGWQRERRWVIYKGSPEASAVPPLWNAWLHHAFAQPPLEGAAPRQPWQKDHQPNLTGSTAAHLPSGHTLKGGKRAQATGDYEAWTP